jgi:ketosteroid isomerase-like protein
MKFYKLTAAVSFAAVAFLAAPRPCVASASTDAMATVTKAIMAFNRGDLKGFAALCTSPASVIDDFPPHSWSGENTCNDWAAALAAANKSSDISNETVLLGAPWHVDVTGDRAYVVVPASLRYNMKGKPVKETGSVFTVVLAKTAKGWLMSAWSWAQH